MTDDDELRTRQGKFLDVAETAVGYRETSLKGEITEYIKATCPIEVSIENLTIHVTSDVASGTVRPLLMGNTAEKFRAIGTEGNYQIFQVAISSSIPPGTAVIRSVDSKDGHALRSEMSVGLQDETINKLVERLPGTLRLGEMGLEPFYSSNVHSQAHLLDHWQRHVVPSTGTDDVTTEWTLTFSTATLSPAGYSRWFGNFPRDDTNDRLLSGSIKVQIAGSENLAQSMQAIQGLATNATSTAKNMFGALAVIVALLIFMAFRTS